MPLPTRGDQVYAFPQLNPETYHGLPGLLADALPDRFGNQLINAWLATQGRNPADCSSVDGLCYIANRGMGAHLRDEAAEGLAALLAVGTSAGGRGPRPSLPSTRPPARCARAR